MKVFITGGTTGIGLSLGISYLEEGHIVGLCGRDLKKLPDGFVDQYPRVKLYEVNVVDRESLRGAILDFSSDGLDVIIANAGRSVGSKSKVPDFKAARDVINVNVIGVLNTLEPAVEVMMKQSYGHIVAVASVAGYVGLPGASSYSASKAAVLKLCESYSLDLKQFGISVTAIAPGFIDTPLTRKNDHSMPWLMAPERAAKIIRSGLRRKKRVIIFPWQMKILIMFLEKIPRCLYRFLMQSSVANYSK